MVAGALQETRWFGCGTYEVGDNMVLTSGRKAPREGQTVRRSEGVALVLKRQALARGVCPQSCRWIRDHRARYSVYIWCPAMYLPEQQVGRINMLFSRSWHASSAQCHQGRGMFSLETSMLMLGPGGALMRSEAV